MYICKRILKLTMKSRLTITLCILALLLQGCLKVNDDMASIPAQQSSLGFDITVTREGEPVSKDRVAPRATKGSVIDAYDIAATMDRNRPFSLVAVEQDSQSLLLDNYPVYSDQGGEYSLYLDAQLLQIPSQVLFSAYYPHVANISYQEGNSVYSIPFEESETEAGPLVSRTVERSISQLNTLPLEFGHITNDIGFKVCDITPNENLRGLIHLKKLTAMNVASAGVFVNDLIHSRGNWDYQGYYRDVTVFEGDAVVGIGSENEHFVGQHELVEHMSESSRFYAIPDEIRMGRQYVEVIYDVDGFFIDQEYYSPLKGLEARYLIYGVLPGNVMVPGKQYTFHLGLDLSTVFREINFCTSNAGESKIYENNDDF